MQREFFAVLFCLALVMAQRETAYADEPARQTATGDWFGHGQAMRDAGLDLRVEQSQFYQGLTRGGGTKDWQYGGKWDVLGRIDLAKWGLWEGISLTAQGNFNYGESVNGLAGSLVPANAALFFPGIDGADASDIMALYLSQDFGKLVSWPRALRAAQASTNVNIASSSEGGMQASPSNNGT